MSLMLLSPSPPPGSSLTFVVAQSFTYPCNHSNGAFDDRNLICQGQRGVVRQLGHLFLLFHEKREGGYILGRMNRAGRWNQKIKLLFCLWRVANAPCGKTLKGTSSSDTWGLKFNLVLLSCVYVAKEGWASTYIRRVFNWRLHIMEFTV